MCLLCVNDICDPKSADAVVPWLYDPVFLFCVLYLYNLCTSARPLVIAILLYKRVNSFSLLVIYSFILSIKRKVFGDWITLCTFSKKFGISNWYSEVRTKFDKDSDFSFPQCKFKYFDKGLLWSKYNKFIKQFMKLSSNMMGSEMHPLQNIF